SGVRPARRVDRPADRVSVRRRRPRPRARSADRARRGAAGRQLRAREGPRRCREPRPRRRAATVFEPGSEEDPIIDLYSLPDVARTPGVQESRLRYWQQTGFLGATVRKGGRFYYTFCDLVAVKSAKDPLEADIPLQKARKAVHGLRKALPDDTHP